MRDLLLYVNVPFCASKCHFCAWVAGIPVRDLRLTEQESPRAAYVEAVTRHISSWAPDLIERGYRPRIMYWGGGTASILSIAEFQQIMGALRDCFDISGLAEATMECSPDSVTPDKLAAYRDAGFDRVSFGVQSFDDRILVAQGRSHRADQARQAVGWAHAAGFSEINVDLMCGLPNETVADAEFSARAALDLPITHASLYVFRPVRGTVEHRRLARGVDVVDYVERLAAFERVSELFEAAGLPEYAFGYFGRRPCRADLAYYRLEMDWAGFGSGASSLLDGELRYSLSALHEYNADPLASDRRLPAGSAPHLIFQGLGTFEGVDARLWQERTKVPLPEALSRPHIASMLQQITWATELIEDAAGVRLPRDGMRRAFAGPPQALAAAE